jgi:uncharacterized protein YrrD
MVNLESFNEWRGEDVVDPGGDRIGKLDRVYYDTTTDQPLFLGVMTGHLFHHLVLVPVAGTTVGRDRISTDRAKSVVEHSPTIDPDDELSADVESAVFDYYGLPYDGAAGHRLVRR